MALETQPDWRKGISLQKRWKIMFEKDLMCDVTFTFPNKRQIKAHKFILFSASSEFEKLFADTSGEKSIGNFHINDCDENTFRVMLEHLYSGETVIQLDNVEHLVAASMQYKIQPLADHCREFLMSKIDTDHACLVFGIAFTHLMTDLQTEALRFILQNGDECLQSKAFLSLPIKSIPYIVNTYELDCREETVYRSLTEWSELVCKKSSAEVNDKNIKSVLGEVFDYIRFPLMNIDFFTTNVANKALLSEGEKLKVYQDISSTGKLSVRRRKCRANHILRCGGFHPEKSMTDLNVEATISVSAPGLLTSVLLFGSKEYVGTHKVEITITKANEKFTTERTLHSMEGQEIYEVLLDKPVEMTKYVSYDISLIMDGPATFIGKSYYTTLSGKDGFTAQLSFADPKSSKDSQIAGLAFERNPNYFFPSKQ